MARGYGDIAAFLDSFGPCKSSTVVKALAAKGSSVDAAKKRVSRAVSLGVVWRVQGTAVHETVIFEFDGEGISALADEIEQFDE
ncbi:hypothetical protein [Anatilimnocola floriformis]|uniref:hypothetical protein n=1 Tax=Anatilimnocola floriformis TaxID=2948575 RepID=UPI0020C47D72|nr:hypothetical protein [Anatilimnocola floriformis]